VAPPGIMGSTCSMCGVMTSSTKGPGVSSISRTAGVGCVCGVVRFGSVFDGVRLCFKERAGAGSAGGWRASQQGAARHMGHTNTHTGTQAAHAPAAPQRSPARRSAFLITRRAGTPNDLLMVIKSG
jgi:hypothetical protein